jgi:hypothetical protein
MLHVFFTLVFCLSTQPSFKKKIKNLVLILAQKSLIIHIKSSGIKLKFFLKINAPNHKDS